LPIRRKTFVNFGFDQKKPIKVKYAQSSDDGQIWIHPERGLQSKRTNESWRGFKEGFDGILATRRVDKVVQIQFTSHNHIEIELTSTAKAVDLHIYLEGMTNLLGKFFSEDLEKNIFYGVFIRSKKLSIYKVQTIPKKSLFIRSKQFQKKVCL